jgi:hypothetical protein
MRQTILLVREKIILQKNLILFDGKIKCELNWNAVCVELAYDDLLTGKIYFE